jgi:hypothetical protein
MTIIATHSGLWNPASTRKCLALPTIVAASTTLLRSCGSGLHGGRCRSVRLPRHVRVQGGCDDHVVHDVPHLCRGRAAQCALLGAVSCRVDG